MYMHIDTLYIDSYPLVNVYIFAYGKSHVLLVKQPYKWQFLVAILNDGGYIYIYIYTDIEHSDFTMCFFYRCNTK